MFVPGSPFQVNHPFAWYAIVKHKATGKQFTYWMNGSQLDRESVAAHIAQGYPNVEVLTIEKATGPPQRTLMPVPANHYECGVRERIEREVAAERASELGLIARVKPIIIKPLVIRPINPVKR